jgi:G3E family GTPase
MKLHLVGGFLGSGKTTAIINAAKSLMKKGKKVGVVTNDQGKYLVDTAFLRLADVPTVEVTGGCFCCNYDDLEARLDQICSDIQPDIVFAESVGSCGDLVSTVIKPLIRLRGSDLRPVSFSVFTDCRLLRMYLTGQEFPFSEDVSYIFKKQIQEAGVLIINKIDLLVRDEASELYELTKEAFPGILIHTQSSIDIHDIHNWLKLIETGDATFPQNSLEIDYRRYGNGEAQLAWLDTEISLEVPEDKGGEVVKRLIEAIREEIRSRKAAIGHLKFMVQGGGVQEKISITTISNGDRILDIPKIPGRHVSLLVNARVEIPAEELKGILDQALERVRNEINSSYFENGVSYFHPGFPSPKHRIG